MAVGENNFPGVKPVPGLRLGVASAGIKTPGRLDTVVFELAPEATVAGVFTRNAFCAAPVTVAREHLFGDTPTRYWLVNTGNANAGTGEQGMQDARSCCEALAKLTATSGNAVLPFSTGVIGEPLPVELITAALPAALSDLDSDNWERAATGILTTDTRPKGRSISAEAEGVAFTVSGIAKGAGMIRPNMATMLSYVATDLAVETPLLQKLLASAVEVSFNRVTVDGDTSTNDACVAAATGAAGNAVVTDRDSPLATALADALTEVCVGLAQELVRDGEGVSKYVAVEIAGGASEAECLDVAFTIAHSPLVKTALFASDPNWGRLLAAIGRAGIEDLDVEGVTVSLNDVLIAERGCRAASYTEEQGVAAMAPDEIHILVNLGRGDAAATVWTTDFSYDYVRINAEYRT